MATRYIKKYADETAIHTAVDNQELLNPYVAYDESAGTIDWNSYIYIDYSKEPLTFDITSGGTIYYFANYNNYSKTLEYSINNEEWVSITPSSNSADTSGTNAISVNAGDIVKFRGNSGRFNETSNYLYTNRFISSDAVFSIYGNIMSLLLNTFSELTTIQEYEFCRVFYECTGLTNASNLVLPATTLASNCYYGMFNDCTSLTTAPELPATTLAGGCYMYMFGGCLSLTTAPELPATTLAEVCYRLMFQSCTSLTTAPELPAQTLTNGCYREMFQGCTNLNYIKCLATDISASYCTETWVDGVASTGTFVKALSMTEWTIGTFRKNGIPANWTVEEV